MTDESERDDLKFGLGDLKDRDALNRLPEISTRDAEAAERSVSDALYPERQLHSVAHRPGNKPAVPRGIELADVEAAILASAELADGERSQLLAYVRALAEFHSRAAFGS
jgi:hypothetical protein